MNLIEKIEELKLRGCTDCPHVVIADKELSARYKVELKTLGLKLPGCIEWKNVDGQIHDLFLVHANRHFDKKAHSIDELLELTDPDRPKEVHTDKDGNTEFPPVGKTEPMPENAEVENGMVFVKEDPKLAEKSKSKPKKSNKSKKKSK